MIDDETCQQCLEPVPNVLGILTAQRGTETVFFCCEECRDAWLAEHAADVG